MARGKPDPNAWKIEYVVCDLAAIALHYAKSFKAPRGREIAGEARWWIDPTKNAIVFQVYHKPKQGQREDCGQK